MFPGGSGSRIGAGGLVMAPRGMPQAFKATIEGTRILCLHTPGRCQAFYMDAGVPLEDGDPGSGDIGFGRVTEPARRNGGIEIPGPSPFAAERP